MSLVPSDALPLDWEAKNFNLKGTDENRHSLDEYKDKKGALVVFTCNHCPYAIASWPIFIELHKQYGNDIGFFAINPNDEINYPDDSFEQMKVKKEEWNIPFPYLRDETQEVAQAYKAMCTPDPYLFSNKGGIFKLFYHGKVNDNWQNPDEVKDKHLEDAINSLLKNQPPPAAQLPSMGCSIKWKEESFEETLE